MRIVRVAAIGLLSVLTITTGCGQNRPMAESVDVPGGTTPSKSVGLSPEQQTAIERIRATGADIELAEDGFPVRIDLASDRVFANEDLVRAALQFPGLRGLRLAVSSVTEQTLAELSSFSDLEEFLLQDAAVDDATLSELLRAMPRLRRLTLRRLNQVTDTVFDAVADCRDLEVVALIEMNQLTGAGVERLADIPRLRSLDLRNCGSLTTEDLACLSSFEGLIELKIGGPAVNDEVAGVVLALQGLQSLSIEDAEVSAAFLKKIASAKPTATRLQTLAFARCFGVTDEALEVIDELPSLKTLSLRDVMISGEFLARLNEAGKSPLTWTTLIVTNAFLDDAKVAYLPGLAPDLEYLDLRGNPGITEEARSTFEELQHLKELK